jgi:hypothetical protein
MTRFTATEKLRLQSLGKLPPSPMQCSLVTSKSSEDALLLHELRAGIRENGTTFELHE